MQVRNWNMGYHYIEKRINSISLNSINAFANIVGKADQNCKEVFFLSVLGVNGMYREDIAELDKSLMQKAAQGQAVYYRFLGFPQLTEAQDIQVYSQYYDNWIQNGKTVLFTNHLKSSDGLEAIIGTAVCKVLESYHTYHPNASASMEKNFVVKLLFWLDNMGYDFIKNPKADLIRKCVIHNVTKEQEYYFCYLLVLLGIDVLLLQNKSDIDEKAKKLGIIQEIVIGAFREIELPKYNRNQYSNVISNGSENECENKNFSNALGSNSRNYNVNAVRNSNQQQNCENRQHNNQEPRKIVIKIPRHQGHDAHAAQQKQSMALQPDSGWTAMQPSDGTNSSDQRRDSSIWNRPSATSAQGNRSSIQPAASLAELAFEDLALRASSIVMIAIHDKSGKIVGSGSGIMVGRDGYILTNNHVTCGSYYSVRIEDDNTAYKTEELIKYNSVLDLAVIRIDRQLQPLPIYQGRKPLVRGQKVVAIGSPLGFFNTVSDGIISGFRKIDNVDMIQFTAPISDGSSGGAVLNMQGEVVGIVTLGFDEGQNINLAVGYEFIHGFVRGFQ